MGAVRPSLDAWALSMAKVVGQRSTCLRRAVGCVLLDKQGLVLATGYNGVASGQPHCNEPKASIQTFMDHVENPDQPRIIYPHACSGAAAESGTMLDSCEAIHAEQNALLQCQDVRQIHTCYVTTSPCVTCTKLLLNTSCQRIIYQLPYPQPEAKALWEKAGRTWDTTMEAR